MTNEIIVTKRDGSAQPADRSKISRQIRWAAQGLNLPENKLKLIEDMPLYPGITTEQIRRNAIGMGGDYISVTEPDWTFFAARVLLQTVYKEANDGKITYPHLADYLARGVAESRVQADLASKFDLERLNDAICPERDKNFDYLGMQTLADRYFFRSPTTGKIIELPQHFWMRIAMGTAQAADTIEKRTEIAIERYETYSNFEAMSSTPTLFNSGGIYQQLSSCFGHTWYDDTDSIMDNMKETAKYSKFAGGDSVSATRVRSKGSPIKSTGGVAGGPIPYTKIYNDILLGFDQSGKRKGVGAIYLEPWHANIKQFLELRENGDDRERAHDCFPALWLNDLFMQRVEAEGSWTLFDPAVVPHLCDLYDSRENGFAFTKAYELAEQQGLGTETIDANELWQLMLTRLYNHGVYWPCFKDTVNARTMQHGMVQHSNLCTEITLRDNEDLSFVCNLGSINVAHRKHLLKVIRKEGERTKFEWNDNLERTVRKWVRNLDDVITIGVTPHEKGRNFQLTDRAIGLGAMGEVLALNLVGIPYESKEHVQYVYEMWRQISLTAIHESALRARELGAYPAFADSRWAQGQLPTDTLQHTRVLEGFDLVIDLNTPFATEAELRALVKGGMRNSALMAIAPTATIANIIGVPQSHELPWDVEYVKENLSGTFKVIAPTVLHNPFGLPTPMAREVDQKWNIWSAAARQVNLDQSQSLNTYADPNKNFEELGDDLDEWYFEGWRCGLKTNYYLYARAAEGSQTVATRDNKEESDTPEPEGAACFLRPGDPGFADCEACQ